jgi:hypothetical protein
LVESFAADAKFPSELRFLGTLGKALVDSEHLVRNKDSFAAFVLASLLGDGDALISVGVFFLYWMSKDVDTNKVSPNVSEYFLGDLVLYLDGTLHALQACTSTIQQPLSTNLPLDLLQLSIFLSI